MNRFAALALVSVLDVAGCGDTGGGGGAGSRRRDRRGGIAGNRLVARGYGQDRPVASNADETGRARNRRVELVKL